MKHTKLIAGLLTFLMLSTIVISVSESATAAAYSKDFNNTTGWYSGGTWSSATGMPATWSAYKNLDFQRDQNMFMKRITSLSGEFDILARVYMSLDGLSLYAHFCFTLSTENITTTTAAGRHGGHYFEYYMNGDGAGHWNPGVAISDSITVTKSPSSWPANSVTIADANKGDADYWPNIHIIRNSSGVITFKFWRAHGGYSDSSPEFSCYTNSALSNTFTCVGVFNDDTDNTANCAVWFAKYTESTPDATTLDSHGKVDGSDVASPGGTINALDDATSITIGGTLKHAGSAVGAGFNVDMHIYDPSDTSVASGSATTDGSGVYSYDLKTPILAYGSYHAGDRYRVTEHFAGSASPWYSASATQTYYVYINESSVPTTVDVTYSHTNGVVGHSNSNVIGGYVHYLGAVPIYGASVYISVKHGVTEISNTSLTAAGFPSGYFSSSAPWTATIAHNEAGVYNVSCCFPGGDYGSIFRPSWSNFTWTMWNDTPIITAQWSNTTLYSNYDYGTTAPYVYGILTNQYTVPMYNDPWVVLTLKKSGATVATTGATTDIFGIYSDGGTLAADIQADGRLGTWDVYIQYDSDGHESHNVSNTVHLTIDVLPGWTYMHSINDTLYVPNVTWYVMHYINDTIYGALPMPWYPMNTLTGDFRGQSAPAISEALVFGIVWLIMIFMPAIVLNNAMERMGFLIGFPMMLMVFAFTQPNFWYIAIIGCAGAIIAWWRGEL